MVSSYTVFPSTGVHQSLVLLVRVGCVIGSSRYKVFFFPRLHWGGFLFIFCCRGISDVSGYIMLGTERTRSSVGRWTSGWTGSLRIWCPRGPSLCCLTVLKPWERKAIIEVCVIPHRFTEGEMFTRPLLRTLKVKMRVHGFCRLLERCLRLTITSIDCLGTVIALRLKIFHVYKYIRKYRIPSILYCNQSINCCIMG